MKERRVQKKWQEGKSSRLSWNC